MSLPLSGIAEAVRTVEGAEMDGLCRKGDEERVGFELRIAGMHNIEVARSPLSNFGFGRLNAS